MNYESYFGELGGVLAIWLILWGLAHTLWGYRFFIFLAVITSVSVGGLLGYSISNDMLGVALGSLVGGLLCWFVHQVGIFLIGIMLGAYLTLVFASLFGGMLEASFVTLLALLGIAGGIFTLLYQRFAIILSTSYFGSFVFISWFMLVVDISVFDNRIAMGLIVVFSALFGTMGLLYQFGKLKFLLLANPELDKVFIRKQDIQQKRIHSRDDFLAIAKGEVAFNDGKYGSSSFKEVNNLFTKKIKYNPSKIDSRTLTQQSGKNIGKVYSINWKNRNNTLVAVLGCSRGSFKPEIDIQEETVSKEHLLLRRKSEKIVVMHLSNSNSTFLNNKRLEKGARYEIKKNDELVVGNIHLKVT